MKHSTAGQPEDAGAASPRSLEPTERKAVGALAVIYGARMLGLFMMLPVLFLYGSGLRGGTTLLAGLAVGAYGLTQAVLQIPFGYLSDRLGRRPVIAAGLVLFAVGSALGAMAGSIGAVIVARMVQGAGAISGPVTALLADLTRTEVRTRAMALIGISIGGAFVVSLVAAPVLDAAIGVPGIFLVMGALAIVCLVLLYAVVPHPPPLPQAGGGATTLGAAFRRDLLPHYLGILVLNGVLSATFIGVPYALRVFHGIAVGDHWRTYLGVFLASVPPTIPLVLLSERAGRSERTLRIGIVLLVAALALIGLGARHYWPLCGALVVFFTAFNYLEARLPARLSQTVEPALRGAAMSVFATAQFLGSFGGATAAGWIVGGAGGLPGVFAAATLVTVVWAVVPAARRA